MRASTSTLLIAPLVALMASPAQADYAPGALVYIYGAYARAGDVLETDQVFSDTWSSGDAFASMSKSASSWDYDYGMLRETEASISAHAQVGALHATATSKFIGKTSVGAEAFADLMFRDTLTITGTPGEWVTVAYTATLHGVHGCGGGDGGGAIAKYTFNFANQTHFPNGDHGTLNLTGCGEQTRDYEGFFYALPGDRVTVFSELNVFAKNGDSMDAGHTARVFIDVKTPGAGFAADSGFAYSVSAVPEPTSGLMLGAGVLALMGRVYRRRSAGR
ncbi:PEP-CTERM sorting domain-containing protein [Roseateles sp.]|uniref:PEP-CTERM sorting domain-containing protein n=1 Tax=Roseateles sp. TaxID=1971397 RepID=UPI00394DDFE2